MAKPANPNLGKTAPVPTRGGKIPVKPTPASKPTAPKETKPTAPPAPKSTLPAVRPTGAVTTPGSYKERMAALVEQTKKAETPQGGFISFKNSRMSIGGTQLPNDTIRAIIVNYWKDNQYFDKPYVAGESNVPACHAIVPPWAVLTPWREAREGEDTDGLTVDESTGLVTDAPDVQVEAGRNCESCELSQWGSMGTRADGRKTQAPACRMTRRLQILAADQCTTPGDIESAPFMTMIPPPTSLDNFKTIANEITSVLDVPIFGAIVDISLKLHDKYQFQIHYKLVEQIEDEGILLALLNRHESLAARPIAMPKIGDSKETRDARGGKF